MFLNPDLFLVHLVMPRDVVSRGCREHVFPLLTDWQGRNLALEHPLPFVRLEFSSPQT